MGGLSRSHSDSNTHYYFTRPATSSSRGVFSGPRSRSSGRYSYYRRRPRDGYIAQLVHRLKRMVRELWAYAKRHPLKAFFAIVVPLLSAGGALHGLLRQLGIRIPVLDGFERRYTGAGGYYGSRGYDPGYGHGADDWYETAGNLVQIVRQFV
ncbi:hypothetical protein K470DRAFT_274419 [Piedraia hortae CBS 480.64]|uniref:Uncharacterized protein n=1 Tax=Piedraia hortae CBS 480.64 TaxID=1314780 RepID=A0A6A7C7X6_9PEZI|nr:hypothetical protein K470DRAFT_274419 [Piedraia hortae CBS 480.64]